MAVRVHPLCTGCLVRSGRSVILPGRAFAVIVVVANDARVYVDYTRPGAAEGYRLSAFPTLIVFRVVLPAVTIGRRDLSPSGRVPFFFLSSGLVRGLVARYSTQDFVCPPDTQSRYPRKAPDSSIVLLRVFLRAVLLQYGRIRHLIDHHLFRVHCQDRTDSSESVLRPSVLRYTSSVR